MALVKSNHLIPSRPGFSRFLIALFLVKSKPANSSTQEYLSSLRSYIKEGCRLEGSKNLQAYVDTSAFWRDAYKKSEEAQVQLRAQVFELERRRENQNDQANGTSIEDASQGKRKRLEIQAGGIVIQHPPKKPRAITNDPKSLVEMMPFQNSLADMTSSSSGQCTSAFVHRFYILQQLSSQTDPDCKSLALALSQICSDIRQIVFHISSQILDVTTTIGHSRTTTRAQLQKTIHSQPDIDHDLQTKLIAIGRIFPYLLKAVHKLVQSDQGEGFEARVIYHFVKLFRDLLQHICALSTPHIKTNERPTNSQKNKKSTRAKSKVVSLPKTSQTQDRSITRLCHFLNILVTALDTSNATDKEILEGFLFFLLHRVGTTLRTFVFCDDANNILAPKLVPQYPSSSPRNYEEERQNAEAQAPYLIPILSHAIYTATRQPPSPPTPTPTPHNSTNPPTPPAKPPHPRPPSSTSLQSTLLTALFGPTCAADFPTALPDPDTQIQNDDWAGTDGMPGEDEGGVAGWFKAEVWRIVGWDVLAGCIAWE